MTAWRMTLLWRRPSACPSSCRIVAWRESWQWTALLIRITLSRRGGQLHRPQLVPGSMNDLISTSRTSSLRAASGSSSMMNCCLQPNGMALLYALAARWMGGGEIGIVHANVDQVCSSGTGRHYGQHGQCKDRMDEHRVTQLPSFPSSSGRLTFFREVGQRGREFAALVSIERACEGEGEVRCIGLADQP